MKEKEFKHLEPCSINGTKFKVLAANEKGKGFCSPCPQLNIDIEKGATGVAVIGYNNILKIREMLDHALSNGKGIF